MALSSPNPGFHEILSEKALGLSNLRVIVIGLSITV
jgi:hypothetical protein